MIEHFTSPLASREALVLWGILCLVSLYMGSIPVSILFLALFLVTILTRFLGTMAIRKVEIRLRCDRDRLFPGEETELQYQICNRKVLPLPWLELAQNEAPRGCLMPDEGFEVCHIPGRKEGETRGLRQTLPGVAGHGALTLSHRWKAVRRGIYRIDELSARSGDGFGLVQRESMLPFSQTPTIAVYPAPVEVNTAPFTRIQWDARASRQGWMEDTTVLQGNREYQPGDSWKAINWRLAAREQGLPVNLYQPISPLQVRFILDGESFAEDEEGLEAALSVLGSLLTTLAERRMELSLTLSQSRDFPAVTLAMGAGGDVSEMMLYLAGFEALRDMIPEKEGGSGLKDYRPSVFPHNAVPSRGSCWLIIRDGGKLPEELIRRIPAASLRILCREGEEIPEAVGLHAMKLDDLILH